MSYISNGRKRPKIRKRTVPATVVATEEEVKVVVEEVETVAEEVVVEEEVVVVDVAEEDGSADGENEDEIDDTAEEDKADEDVAEEVVVVDGEETLVEVADDTAEEDVVEEVKDDEDETVEDLDEVPLEISDDEVEVVLEEEASLDGDADEVSAVLEENAKDGEEEVVVEVADDTAEEEIVVEEVKDSEEEVVVEVADDTAEEEVVVEEVKDSEEEVVVEVADDTAEEEVVVEEVKDGEEEVVATAVESVVEEAEETDEDAEEEKVEEKPKKDEFKLTAPDNLEDVLSRMCTKRARKLIYRPGDVIFSHTTTVLGTDKVNDEKIKIKNILDAEIKQGVKLGYLDKFDGLKMSEIKEEYENDIVYEYADQEFKRTGILLDGDKVKVYIYDWDMKACHHVGYIDDESAELVKPYIIDREKYSFDINGIIVGGKYKKVIKDEKTGKITVEKGNDGNLGLEIDINIINRKD